MTYRELLSLIKNLDDEIDLTLLIKDKIKKAYIYLTGHEDKKILIEGDFCYEVSEKMSGEFTFDEAQENIETLLGKDWRLPSKDELNLIYNTLKVAGQIQDEDWYWSSSLTSNKSRYAWDQNFSDGYQNYTLKEMYCSVRAIRSFKILSLQDVLLLKDSK